MLLTDDGDDGKKVTFETLTCYGEERKPRQTVHIISGASCMQRASVFDYELLKMLLQ